MAKIKFTKSVVVAVQPQDKAIELQDTVVPGVLCKITPAGRKMFMLQYRTSAGERRKSAFDQYGELTVDQARTMAQEWLAEVRKAAGVPTKVGMKLIGHKTVPMFMRYVHTEDKQVRDAAELVASRRLAIMGVCCIEEVAI